MSRLLNDEPVGFACPDCSGRGVIEAGDVMEDEGLVEGESFSGSMNRIT
jgi:hypothetical protein